MVVVERRVAETTAAELHRDWMDLSLGPGRLAPLEACGTWVGLVWQGEGRVDVRSPGPQRGHVLHNLFANLPGENDLDALVLVGSDGAVRELLEQAQPLSGLPAVEGPWAEAPLPLALRTLAGDRLRGFDPKRQSGRSAHPGGESLWAPSEDLGGLLLDLRLTGMVRQRQRGLEVVSPWLTYQRTRGAGTQHPNPVSWSRRATATTGALLMAELPSEGTLAAAGTPFAEERRSAVWNLDHASVSLLVEPTFGLDRDLQEIDVTTTLTLLANEPTSELTLSLAEGRQRTYAPSWGPTLVEGVARVEGEDLTPVPWSRVGDRIFVHLGPTPPGEAVTLRVRHKGQLIEPFGTTAATALAGWRWYPMPPGPDRHTFELVTLLPRFWRAPSTGRAISEEETGTHRKITSRSRRAVPQGAVLIVDADPTTWPSPGPGLPVLRIHRSPGTPIPNHAGLAEDLFGHLTRLAHLLGPFPYAELEVVEHGVNPNLGDLPGLIALGRMDAPPDAPITSRAGDRTVVSALARQWLGADQGPNSDHDRWLIEGLASWAECFALADGGRLGRCESSVAASRRAWLDTVRNVDAVEDWPVGPVWLGQASGWGYANRRHRGPLVLHMLRLLLGDAPSRALLTQMATTYAGQRLSSRSFIHRAQALTGQDLRRFFYGWVYATPQEPVAQVAWTTAQEADGTWTLLLTGALDDGIEDADPLPMVAPLLLRMRLDGAPTWQKVLLTELETTTALRGIPHEPKDLKLDPGRAFPGRVEFKRGGDGG